MLITSLSQLDKTKKYSYADYLKWQFEEMVELIKGFIVPMSSPKVKHQRVSMNLSIRFGNYLLNKKCDVFSAPFDVKLKKNNDDPDNLVDTVVIPDICIVCDQSKLDSRGCNGGPDLIVEILSDSTAKKDQVDKLALYEENGVLEYWIVAPESEWIDVYIMDKGKYLPAVRYVEGSIKVSLFDDLEVEVDKVFGR